MDFQYKDLWILSNLEEGESLEGFLYPDTYSFLPEMTSPDIIRSMIENLQDQFAGIDLDKSRFKTIKELIIFSSIVQKESPLEDMDIIAGVFANRLNIGKRLESDATVNYFLGTSKLIPTHKDITNKNSYNTYLNGGLPSGAISNPGFKAIYASLNPAEHDYLFFLHTPDGETKLSKTFKKHLEYRKKYWE